MHNIMNEVSEVGCIWTLSSDKKLGTELCCTLFLDIMSDPYCMYIILPHMAPISSCVEVMF